MNRLLQLQKILKGRHPSIKIKSILSRFCYVNVNAPRFFGGMVGYFAYDCVHSLFGKVRQGIRQQPDFDTGTRTAKTMTPGSCLPKTASSLITHNGNSTSFQARSSPTIPTLKTNITGVLIKSGPCGSILPALKPEKLYRCCAEAGRRKKSRNIFHQYHRKHLSNP